MTGALKGIKVVEFAGLGPAPLAGQLLADMGADVTVIDRRSAPRDPTDINRRGKRSIALNLKTAAGRDIAMALFARADLLIEGFRPGVMERLQLGPQDCPETLIYGRMTGWGQSGPLSMQAGHDLTYLATSGVLGLMGPPDGPPQPPLNLVADYGGGAMFLVFGMLAALIERGQSGRGQVVDAAMVDGVPAMMGLIHQMMAQGTWTQARGQNMLDGGAPFYRCYPCADGRYVAVGALEPQFYAQLLTGLGLEAEDLSEQNDRTAWPILAARFAEVFARQPLAHWTSVFEGTDACVAPVLTLEEAQADPHMHARATYVEQDGVLQAAPAPRLSRSGARRVAPPDAPGADADAILDELGYDADAIAAMRSDGTLT